MSTLALLVLAQVAWAGHWLPEAEVELEPATPWLVDQQAGSRRLFRAEPAEVIIEAWSEGARIPLVDGPDDTLLLPAVSTSRQVELRTTAPVELQWWRESSQGEAAAWDRHVASLKTWAVQGGTLPPPPSSIPSLHLEWTARREAMVAMSELDPALLVQCALIELDAQRATSPASAAVELHEPIVLEIDEPGTLEVHGPGRVTLRTRAAVGTQGYTRYQMRVGLDHEPLRTHQMFTTEDEEHTPGWGWPRELTLSVPPGDYRIRYELVDTEAQDIQVVVEAQVERRRPSLAVARATFPRLSPPGPRRETLGPVGRLETAHLTGTGDVVELATSLLDGPAADLARARLIEHHPDPERASALYEEAPPKAVTALALARRWVEHRDVEPRVLLEAADLLPRDPALLAELADGLPWGFLRPRGRAIRSLAGLEEPSSDDSRWTQLAPARDKHHRRVEGAGAGIHRVGVGPEQVVDVILPEPAREHRFPVLRLEADEPTTYRIDGTQRRGMGSLHEALAPGRHTVSSEQGTIFVMDAALAEGGTPWRDKAVGPLPNRWVLPDPGAPGEVEVHAWGVQGPLLLSADDGATWELYEPPDGDAPGEVEATLRVGASATELLIEGDPGAVASVALRRNNVEPEVVVPSPWPDPLGTLSSASRAMITTRDERQMADLRLLRAVSLGALGLVHSARHEARAVAAMPEASAYQRAQGKEIYRSTTPPVHTAEVPGPVTVDAALAWMGKLPVETDSCESLSRIANTMVPPVSWAVHREAATCLLEQGDAVGAWTEASRAGALGRIARLRATASGDWQLVSRMDLDGGTRRVRLARQAPDEFDGVYDVVRELSLGAPWLPTEYSVLRRKRQSSIELEGEGELALELLCRDESYAVSPLPCSVTVRVDEQDHEVEIPEASIVRRTFTLDHGEHRVEVGPLGEQDQALAIRASLDGTPLPPQTELTAHLIGFQGARATVAAGSLIRLRVHVGGPLRLQVGGETRTVEDSEVLAVPGSGPVEVRIDGPPQSHFTLSRLHPCAVPEDQDRGFPPPLDTNTPDPLAASVTRHWMNEVARVRSDAAKPIGRGGTLTAWGGAGDDATGVRDSTAHYPYLGLGAGYLRRLDGSRHWFGLEAAGRFGIGALPGAHLDSQWTWAPSAHAVALSSSLGASGGAGHARLRGLYRFRTALGPWWNLQPYAALHAGWYSAAAEGEVDPLAWSSWSARHWAGGTLGSILDWRPMVDARIRMIADLDTNPDFTLDRARVELRTDTMVLPMAVLRLGPELGYRFVDQDRQEAYWRLAVKAGLSYAGYAKRTARWTFGVRGDYLPLENTLEGWLRFQWEWSHARGMRDRTPFDQVFTEAHDLPWDGQEGAL